MKQFNLTKAAARVLYMQLEGKGDGYNIKQIRLLDKILTIFDSKIGEYNKKIQDEVEKAREEVKKDERSVEAINDELNSGLNQITASKGKDIVAFTFEDEQFSFIKNIWDDITGIKGSKDAVKLTIEIDDALSNATEVVVSEENTAS